jgi:hypothetical protein
MLLSIIRGLAPAYFHNPCCSSYREDRAGPAAKQAKVAATDRITYDGCSTAAAPRAQTEREDGSGAHEP